MERVPLHVCQRVDDVPSAEAAVAYRNTERHPGGTTYRWFPPVGILLSLAVLNTFKGRIGWIIQARSLS